MSLAALREPENLADPASSPAPDSSPSPRKIAGVTVGLGEPRHKPLPVRFGALDEALPEGGLPRGAVVEIASPYGLGRVTSIALAACASAQAEAKLRGGETAAGAWCAWIEPAVEEKTGGPPATSLFAPAVARAGIDLARFLVVRPQAEALSRVAVRAAASRVFSMIVIDLAGVPGRRPDQRLDRWVNPVRRLAMAVEGVEATVLLLTDALASRSLPLPVALRLEIDRASRDRLMLAVAKDRRGRVSSPRSIALPEAPEPAPLPVRRNVVRSA